MKHVLIAVLVGLAAVAIAAEGDSDHSKKDKSAVDSTTTATTVNMKNADKGSSTGLSHSNRPALRDTVSTGTPSAL